MIWCDNIPRAFTRERLCTFLRVSGPSVCAFLPSCTGGRGTNPCNLNDWQTPPGCDLVPARHEGAAGPTRSFSLMLPIVYGGAGAGGGQHLFKDEAVESRSDLHLHNATLLAELFQLGLFNMRVQGRTKRKGQLLRSYFSNTQMKQMSFLFFSFFFPPQLIK